MRKSAKLSLLTVLAVLLLSTALWAQKSNWDVRPGEGVGPFHIGMTISECEKYLQRDPQADQVFVRGNMPFWIYYLNGIQINYDSQGCAYQFYIDKPGIVTSRNVQVGDPQEKFLSAYGSNYIVHNLPTGSKQPKQNLYVYKSIGIAFQTEGNRIKFIAVIPRHS